MHLSFALNKCDLVGWGHCFSKTCNAIVVAVARIVCGMMSVCHSDAVDPLLRTWFSSVVVVVKEGFHEERVFVIDDSLCMM